MFVPKYYSSFCINIHEDITQHFSNDELEEFDKISEDYYEYLTYPHFPRPDYYYKEIQHVVEDELCKHNKKLLDYLTTNNVLVSVEVYKNYLDSDDCNVTDEYSYRM